MNSTFTNRILRLMEHHMPLPEPQYTPEQQRERERLRALIASTPWLIWQLLTKQRELEALRTAEQETRRELVAALNLVAYHAAQGSFRIETGQWSSPPPELPAAAGIMRAAIDKHERQLIEIELLAGDIADMRKQLSDPWHWSDEAKPWPRAGRKA